MFRPLSILVFVALPAIAGAQALSGGLGWWTTAGGRRGDAAAHGVRVHGAFGVTLAGLETDLEGGFSQTIFTRAFSTGDSRVNENSLEFIALAHLRRGAVSWWPYAGPVLSVGIGCGTAGDNDPNGKVACDGDSRSEGDVKLGLAAGIALKRPAGAYAFTAEFRAQANTIASARGSGPVLLVAFGLRGR